MDDPDRTPMMVENALKDLGLYPRSLNRRYGYKPFFGSKEDFESIKTEITELRSEFAELRSEFAEIKEMIRCLPVVAGKDYLERHYQNTKDGKMSI